MGPLGSGLGGGVELTLHNMAQALSQRGHHVTTIAPEQSYLPDHTVIEVSGALQITAQTQGRADPIVLPGNAVLAAMWQLAKQIEKEYDILVNFAYDWLPFYLTPWFERPIAHLVSMGSLTDAMDSAIAQVLYDYPESIAMHSRAQLDTFSLLEHVRCLGNGLDLSLYQPCYTSDETLGWVGRIAPEKGIEDAIAAAALSQRPLKVWGAMPDPGYWQAVCAAQPQAQVEYQGFLSTQDLQAALGTCAGLLVTPRWVEAFGNVVIEALACGVPVIAYERGGPAEIVSHGKTGWLVKPDSVAGLVEAIAQLPQINRSVCRQWVETHYSLDAFGDRVDQWLTDVIRAHPKPA